MVEEREREITLNPDTQVVAGMVYLHGTRRLIHRDIKPSNVPPRTPREREKDPLTSSVQTNGFVRFWGCELLYTCSTVTRMIQTARLGTERTASGQCT